MIKVERVVVGLFQTNCYLVETDKGIIIIDPGDNYRKIVERLEKYNKPVDAILLTHGHFDHIGAVDKLADKYHCPVYADKGDEKMMRNEKYNSLNGISATVNCKINWLTGDFVSISGIEIGVVYSPGHSDGSVMYVIDNMLFSGDTLFRLSVGRTDLYSGSSLKLMKSLQCIYTFDRDMTVYPGHEQQTTIGFEIDNNPFLQ